MSEDEMRAVLAADMPPHQTWCQTIGHFDCCGTHESDCDCGVVEALDDLLPTVRHLIAEELREAASDVDDGEFSSRESAAARAAILARADALDGAS